MGKEKQKCTEYLTKGIDKSRAERSDHMILKLKQTIGIQSKNDHRMTDRKPI